jgi:hypothetical protein
LREEWTHSLTFVVVAVAAGRAGGGRRVWFLSGRRGREDRVTWAGPASLIEKKLAIRAYPLAAVMWAMLKAHPTVHWVSG